MEERQQQARINARLLDVEVLETSNEPIRDFTDGAAGYQLRILHDSAMTPAMMKLNEKQANDDARKKQVLMRTVMLATILL